MRRRVRLGAGSNRRIALPLKQIRVIHVMTAGSAESLIPATDQSEYGDERHPDAHAAARQRELINHTKNLESRIQRDIRQRDQANRNCQKGANSFHLPDEDITD